MSVKIEDGVLEKTIGLTSQKIFKKNGKPTFVANKNRYDASDDVLEVLVYVASGFMSEHIAQNGKKYYSLAEKGYIRLEEKYNIRIKRY